MLSHASPALKALARPRGHIEITLCSCAAQPGSDRSRQQDQALPRAPPPPQLPLCPAPSLRNPGQEGLPHLEKATFRGLQHRGRDNREVAAPAQKGHMSLLLSAHEPGHRCEGTGRTSVSAIISATGSSVTSEAASQPWWPWACGSTSQSLHPFHLFAGSWGRVN